MLRRVPPYEACGGVTGFSPWGLHEAIKFGITVTSSLTHSAAPSPAFEGGVKKHRSELVLGRTNGSTPAYRQAG